MTRERRLQIVEQIKDVQEVHPEFSVKDSFFVLYDNEDISGTELDYLMDWMTL